MLITKNMSSNQNQNQNQSNNAQNASHTSNREGENQTRNATPQHSLTDNSRPFWHQYKLNLLPEFFPQIAKHTYKVAVLPSKVDLGSTCGPQLDQLSLGSCSANAIASGFYHIHPSYVASRLYIYYNERSLDGNVNDDAGSYLSTGVRALYYYGAAKESTWPYDISKFAIKPSESSYLEGAKNKLLSFEHVAQNTASIKACLASGFPIVFGFLVYSSFQSVETATTGYAPVPRSGEELLGGHAVLLVGYDDSTKRYKIRNSWGSNWGSNGSFFVDYDFLSDKNLCSDLWALKRASTSATDPFKHLLDTRITRSLKEQAEAFEKSQQSQQSQKTEQCQM